MKIFDLKKTYNIVCKNFNNLDFDFFLGHPVGNPLTIDELTQNITFDFEVEQSFNENIYFYIIAHNWNSCEKRQIGYLYIKDNNGRLKYDHLQPVCKFVNELQKYITY